MINIKRLNHIQICIPFNMEKEAREFYTDILNFKEIAKPIELLNNGGLWYEINDIQFHIGCENEKNNSKRHPAFEVENIRYVKSLLQQKNVRIKEDIAIPNCERFSIFDPFNNRIEFIEKTKNHSKEIEAFWNNFIAKNKKYENYSVPSIDFFCNEEKLTNDLASLVNKGIKTATCSVLIDYQICNDPIPKINELKIIVDWNKKPICITQTKSVSIKKFSEVDDEFARKEGEGDKSLIYWKTAHKNFFSNYLKTIGVLFTEEIQLICEEFEKID